MCGRTETVERRRMVRALAGAAAVLTVRYGGGFLLALAGLGWRCWVRNLMVLALCVLLFQGIWYGLQVLGELEPAGGLVPEGDAPLEEGVAPQLEGEGPAGLGAAGEQVQVEAVVGYPVHGERDEVDGPQKQARERGGERRSGPPPGRKSDWPSSPQDYKAGRGPRPRLGAPAGTGRQCRGGRSGAGPGGHSGGAG